jgi:hypothetical protein
VSEPTLSTRATFPRGCMRTRSNPSDWGQDIPPGTKAIPDEEGVIAAGRVGE